MSGLARGPFLALPRPFARVVPRALPCVAQRGMPFNF